jgi:hypothetical protein
MIAALPESQQCGSSIAGDSTLPLHGELRVMPSKHVAKTPLLIGIH